MVSAVGHGTAEPKTCTGTAKQTQKLTTAALKTCTGTAKQAQNKLWQYILNKENLDSYSKLFLLYEFTV